MCGQGVAVEPLKEAVEAWLQRVRSPILGYSLLAALAMNWKPLWALVFADIDVFSRFLYFDLRTDVCTLFVWPVVIGSVTDALTPWIGLVGIYVVRLPSKLQRELQRDARVEQEIYLLSTQAKIEDAKAQVERAREERTLAEAKRTQEAEKLGPEAVETLRQSRATVEIEGDQQKMSLSEVERFTIMFLGIQPGAVNPDKVHPNAVGLKAFESIVPGANVQRVKIELKDALDRLKKLGLTYNDGLGRWSLTSKGYEEYDHLSK